MKSVSKIIGGVIMLSSLFPSSPSAHSAPGQSLAEGNTAFALDLYSQLKAKPGNLFFSPYSISTALAMTYAGAQGETQAQMARILHFGSQGQQLHAAFREAQNRLNSMGQQEGIELNIANALWTQQGHPFLPEFLAIAKDQYQANVNQANFQTAADATRGEINRWVAQGTKEKIRDILPPGSLNPLTRIVLVNAIYFKGLWAKPYNKAETSVREFYVSANHQAGVPLMHHFDSVRYVENGDFQAVELPYKGGELSMLVLLPRQKDGYSQLESTLSSELLSRSLSQMKQQTVEIFLPRFKLESAFDLNSPLGQMGMPDAFGPRADFSGIDGTRSLYISGVFHKAWGEVNEEGTEATAATALAVATSAVVRKPPPPPPIFRADHPFIFLIRDARSGGILFLGRLIDPLH